ncbi:flagellar hook-basal body complex protein [Rhodobacteraceae bacterium RKSG542]|uniref:flagellar hook protein FlgE n=1 Tax=Pseudovibrio flavus TaxID=2529854 RepID=UPI0012BCE818|nr:flagellar hook-basal body complex protein [Pseudovibrio flavus]MTI19258.1 flagellar hook-basal body complex protein [Pseudovibrio flavus]
MSIYGAINSATTGLDAQAQALENISGNVANSSTTGYKRLDTSFSDLVASTGSTQANQVSGTVYATSRATNTLQGDISSYDQNTYMAINGSGYFVVTDQEGLTSLSPDYYYTRAGDFELDASRQLVNSAGYFLQGHGVNPATGAVSDALETIVISDQPMPAEPSDVITYQANLPSTPATDRFSPDVMNSQYIDESVFANKASSAGAVTFASSGTAISIDDPISNADGFAVGDQFRIQTDAGPATLDVTADTKLRDLLEFFNSYNGVTAEVDLNGGLKVDSFIDLELFHTPNGGAEASQFALDATSISNGGSVVDNSTVIADKEAVFLESTISGGAVTVYDTNGTPVNVEMRWSLNSENNWSLYYNSDPNALGQDVAWSKIDDVSFDAAGRLVSPADGMLSIPDLTVKGVSVGDVKLDFGVNKLTQYEDNIGYATSIDIAQNGYPSGELSGINIDDDGTVSGSYSNGKSMDLYKIPVATFAAEQELQRINGVAFAATPTSGEPDFRNGGSIRAQALESSNADVAGEFSKLIITQQAYAANSKVLSTANQMLDDILNVVR